MRGHPGLLAWYISDDTVNWPHDALRAVYDQIKSWDPHHPVSAAMAWVSGPSHCQQSPLSYQSPCLISVALSLCQFAA